MIPRQIALIIPRLATPYRGELEAARDAIDRGLKGAGLDWHDLARAIIQPATATGSPRSCRPSVFEMAWACRDLDCGRLSAAEKRFVGDMCRLGTRSASQRQEIWLSGIFDRLHGRAAA